MTDTLQTERLTLRAPHAADADARLALGNHADIQHMFGMDPAKSQPITQAQADHWLAELSAARHAWVIEWDARVIGAVRLHRLHAHDRRAVLSIGILDPAHLGQGTGTQAMRLVLDYAFHKLDLHRVSLRVIDHNTRAIAAYRKLGFIEEGRERQSAFVAGRWHDDLIMGLLAPEWSAQCPSL